MTITDKSGNPIACYKCGSTDLRWYDGCLGYESIVCNNCQTDQNDQYCLTFYEDSGHGWLEVPIEMCRRYGLQGKITGFSYCKGSNLYLEEDVDASTFINAMIEHSGMSWDMLKTFQERKYHETSPVRSYGDPIPPDLLKAD